MNGPTMELHLAARAGDINEVKQLLAEKADLEARYSPAPAHGGSCKELTPLMEAASGGGADTRIVRLLLDAGADVQATSSAGMTALWYAAEKGDPGRVRLLLEAGSDPNGCSNNGRSPLMAAAETSWLATGPDVGVETLGSPDCVKLLLAAGPEVDAVGPTNQTALLCAAEDGNGRSVSLLLRAGADPNARCWRGRTPLMRANSREAVRELLRAGSDLDARDEDGGDALSIALLDERAEAVAALLEGGMDTERPNKFGFTPLMKARDVESVRALIEAGADVNARASEDDTPLTCAVWFGAACDCITALIEAGADAEASYFGTSDRMYRQGEWTALRIASYEGHTEQVKRLIAGGAKVNAAGPDGITALMLAASYWDCTEEKVQVLLSAGADPLLKSREGKTAFDYAFAYQSDLADRLRRLPAMKRRRLEENKREGIAVPTQPPASDAPDPLTTYEAHIHTARESWPRVLAMLDTATPPA